MCGVWHQSLRCWFGGVGFTSGPSNVSAHSSPARRCWRSICGLKNSLNASITAIELPMPINIMVG